MSSPQKNYCTTSIKFERSCCGSPEHDAYLSKLKAEVFEKEQNERDYQNLQCKFNKLQNDLIKVTKIKEKYEIELCQNFEDRNKAIADLRSKNENLLNELNEKIAMNKKLYNENNNLFRELEGKTAENQDLQDHMIGQKNMMQKYDDEKNMCERKKLSLSQLNERHLNDIQNLNDQINCINLKNDDTANLLRNRCGQNNCLIKELNDEKILNGNLVNDLRTKENEIVSTQNHLAYAKETIVKLENDLNNLNNQLSQCKNNITNVNNELMKETSIRNEVEVSNKNLDCAVGKKNQDIDKLNCDNELVKRDIVNLENENNNLTRALQEYKKHIMIMTEQNDKLSKELECLMQRDVDILSILNRDGHLLSVDEQNKQLIQNSLDNLQRYIDSHGNNASFTKNKEILYKANNNKNTIFNFNERDKNKGKRPVEEGLQENGPEEEQDLNEEKEKNEEEEENEGEEGED